MVMNRGFQNYSNGFNTNPYFNPQQTQPSNLLKMVAVTNREEANATPVEFNGMPTFFFNQNANEIYLKQFDIATGGKLEVFRKVQMTEEQAQPVVDPNIQALGEKIDNLKVMIENLNLPSTDIENYTKGGKHDK